MKAAFVILVVTGVALLSFSSLAAAPDQACAPIPASATEVETAILENQCKILRKISRITRAGYSEPTSTEISGYKIFNPGSGTTRGNPCSAEGMRAMSCGRFFKNIMDRECPDDRCMSIFGSRVTRVTDAMLKWKNYFEDPNAIPLDRSKLSKYILETPGIVTLDGDAIVLNTDHFLKLTAPSEFMR